LGDGLDVVDRPDPTLTAISVARDDGVSLGQLEHPALLYRSQNEFLKTMVPYVEDGLEADEFVFIAARADNLEALRTEVGPGADVTWVDTDEWHPYTGTRLRAFHDLVTGRSKSGEKRLRLAGEPLWPSGPPELILEWQRYESVLNHVLAPIPATLICLYDASTLDASILDSARRNHPDVYEAGVEAKSTSFRQPAESLRDWAHHIASPPPSASIMLGTLDVPTGRRFVREHALAAGVDLVRAGDLAVAVSELLSNAFIHAGGPTALWTWIDGDRLVCQVDDIGPGLADPFVGYRPPTDAIDGRGLWIVRQLVDLLQLAPSNAGTRARIHLRLA
jgi:anti-sigma regulatory factor (Ser/Thr protein kinase)